MNVEQLKQHYMVLSNTQLAKKINVGRTTVWDWEKKGIPPKTQAFLELQTNGAVKADIQPISA